MARRADHTREQLTEIAVQAGLELIREHGLGGFSARSAASRIGYTVGTIYHVFGSYDQFVLSINALTLDEWYAHIERALAADRSRQPLRAIARAYIDFSYAHTNQWLALFEFHTSDGSTPPDWYMDKMRRFFTLAETALMDATGLSSRKKAKRSARILWAGIHGICLLSLTGKLDLVESDSAEVMAHSFIDTYLAGLGLAT